MLRALYNKLPVIRQLRRLVETQQEQRRLLDYDIRPRLNDLVGLQSAALREQILAGPAYADKLNRFEQSVFSQNGEDGILAEILRRIGVQSRRFVELGAGAGDENNTLFLLAQGWAGGWAEAGARNCERIRAVFRDELANGRLILCGDCVTCENVNAVVSRLAGGVKPDVLSLDIDRNNWHVLEALNCVRPRVLVVEYNASYPADVEWRVEYDAHRAWNGSNCVGASLLAYERLLRKREYVLVACDLTGSNAFFVEEPAAQAHFSPPFTSEHYYEPPRYWLRPLRGHRGCYSDRYDV